MQGYNGNNGNSYSNATGYGSQQNGSHGQQQERAPSFRLATMYRRTKKDGSGSYFDGRLGGGRIALVKTNAKTDDGNEIWNLLINEAPPKQNGHQNGNGSQEGAGSDFDA